MPRPVPSFSLSRLLGLWIVFAVLLLPFSIWHWPWAMLGLAGINTAAAIAYAFMKKKFLAISLFASSLLLVATLINTDWGLSSINPKIRIAWLWLFASCLAQFTSIALWIVDGKKSNK